MRLAGETYKVNTYGAAHYLMIPYFRSAVNLSYEISNLKYALKIFLRSSFVTKLRSL